MHRRRPGLDYDAQETSRIGLRGTGNTQDMITIFGTHPGYNYDDTRDAAMSGPGCDMNLSDTIWMHFDLLGTL